MGWFLELEKTALPSENKSLFKIITISKKNIVMQFLV